MTLRRFSAAALAAAAVIMMLSGCAPDPAPSPTPPPSTAPAPIADASPTPTTTPVTTPAQEPACDTIISDGTVAALTDAGWSHEERDFQIGDITLDEGLLCLWADYSVVSDHGQLYGWSRITPDEAAAAQSWLLGQGWIRESGSAGTYITEDPQFSLGTDDEGYGTTYLFGDGWVALSDTKQGLILIEGAG